MNEKWFAWKTDGLEVDKAVVDFTGSWTNRLGSEMDLRMSGTSIEGTYRTAVGAPGQHENFALVGAANGDLISFVVSWERYGSITAWVGQHLTDEAGEERLHTLWHLVKNVAEAAEESSLWGSVLDGANTFYRK